MGSVSILGYSIIAIIEAGEIRLSTVVEKGYEHMNQVKQRRVRNKKITM